MKIINIYSYKNGKAFIVDRHPAEFGEISDTIRDCMADKCLRKITREKNKPTLLFDPGCINTFFKERLRIYGWDSETARLKLNGSSFREMDGIKNKIGIEIQLGKYAFAPYDIFCKMPIFAKNNLITCGIEIVPDDVMARQMSTGVCSYQQTIDDIAMRGDADVDVPVIVVGIGLTNEEYDKCDIKRERFLNEKEKMIASGEVSSKTDTAATKKYVRAWSSELPCTHNSFWFGEFE